jgi:hypothetical protein
MATDKALYWIAICVMAMGIGQSFFNRHPDFTRNLGQRAMVLADSVSGRTQGQLGHAQVFVAGTRARFDRSQAVAERVQSRLACVQARIAERQAAIASSQALRSRIAAENMRKIVVAVPEIPSKTIVVNSWGGDFDR